MAAPQPIENPQRSYEVFEKKHDMECITVCLYGYDGVGAGGSIGSGGLCRHCGSHRIVLIETRRPGPCRRLFHMPTDAYGNAPTGCVHAGAGVGPTCMDD